MLARALYVTKQNKRKTVTKVEEMLINLYCGINTTDNEEEQQIENWNSAMTHTYGHVENWNSKSMP